MLLEGMRILLAEDDDDLRDLLVESLEEMGAKVVAASGGRQALALFLERLGEIDAIISDMRMPAGDGIEFAQGVQETLRGLSETGGRGKVVFVIYSGYSEADPEALLRAGVDAIFGKPVALESLAVRLRELTQSRASD